MELQEKEQEKRTRLLIALSMGFVLFFAFGYVVGKGKFKVN